MAQTETQTDGEKQIARAVAVASAQLRKEFRLRSENMRCDVRELQEAAAQLTAQIASMKTEAERVGKTQTVPSPPLPPPTPPPPPPPTTAALGADKAARTERVRWDHLPPRSGATSWRVRDSTNCPWALP